MFRCQQAEQFGTGLWAGKVTAGLVESNGSLPPGGWLKVTCGLTACIPGSAQGPTPGNEYGKTLTFFYLFVLLIGRNHGELSRYTAHGPVCNGCDQSKRTEFG